MQSIAKHGMAALGDPIMPWHYAINGQQIGPVSDVDFTRLVNAGTIGAETLVWQEGWSDWRAYRTVVAAVPDGTTDDPDTAVCAVSGRRLPKRDMLEFEGRWVGVEHKEEFFQRLREGVSLTSDVVYGSFGRRFAAKFVDGVIVGAANILMAFALGLLLGRVLVGPGHGPSGAILLQIVVQASGIALALGYGIFFIRKYDATPGKLAMGLRLLRADGTKLSKGRIIGRYFAEWVSGMMLMIGYLMAAFDKEQRRTLHDRMVDTRVIDVRGR